ncbi:hypothetical protein [Halomarina litorea]|uniref:hypothetical protein n=1 Tax=Halomarina litorea TaxID=2961595 RepID=UPI0020C34858|nr:hypothetical protein [Halomarina sp. BCD28]
MTGKHHYRCNLCGKDVDSRAVLDRHHERRHPKADVRWWMVAERPDVELPFEAR